MKTFIFILLLVIGFFYYLFTSDSTPFSRTTNTTTKLEDIEHQDSVQTDKEYTTLDTEVPTAIPEEQTFDTIKSILKESSGREYAPNITLNTRINSYLYTINAQEEFKQKIASTFNLTYDEVEKSYKKNRLVWDWVNQLKD